MIDIADDSTRRQQRVLVDLTGSVSLDARTFANIVLRRPQCGADLETENPLVRVKSIS